MALEPTQAAFTEVLQLGVDLDGFSRQMDRAVEVYTAAINKMPNIDKVSGVAFADSLSKLEKTLGSFSEKAGQALGDLSASMTDTASVIERQMGQAAASVQEGQKLIVDALANITSGQKKTQESTRGVSGFFAELTSNIAETAGAVTKYALVYQAATGVIGATGDVLASPFKAIADGFKYMEDFEERSSQVKAALLQTVQFSANWGQNVKIAGEQADILVRKVDDFAAKLKVSSQSVQTGLTAFLEYGGRNLTQNLDQAVKVSGLVTGALQTQTPNIESRKLIGEIQKLVQGAAGDTDKLAAALGVSKDQLREMVVHAQKYHDLYDEILAKSPGIAERIGDANNRQSALVATLELYKQRWEALIAGPLFQQFTKILQQILEWVDRNDDKLHDLGVNLGLALGKAADAAERFLTGNWQGLVSSLTSVVGMFLMMATTIADIGLHITGIITEYNAWADKFNNSQSAAGNRNAGRVERFASNFALTPEGRQSALDKANQYDAIAAGKDKESQAAAARLKNFSDTEKKLDATLAKMQDVFIKMAAGDTSGLQSLFRSQPKAPAEEADNNPIPNWNPKGDGNGLAGLRDIQEQLRDEIQKTKNVYQELFDEVSAGLAKSTINHRDAAKEDALLYAAEIEDVENLIKEYQKKAAASGAKPTQIDAAVTAMQRELDVLKGQAQKSVNAANRAADAEDLEAHKVYLQEKYQLEVQSQKDRLNLVKQQQTDGLFTNTQAFDLETGIMQEQWATQKRILQEQVDSYADGTVKKQEAIKQLDLAEAQYTANATLRTQQRIIVARQEEQVTFQHLQNQKQATLDQTRIVDTNSDITSSAQRLALARQELELQKEITAASIANALALLDEAKAKNANSQATQALEDRLATLKNAQLSQFAGTVRLAAEAAGPNPANQQIAAQRTANAEIDKLKKTASDLSKAMEQAVNTDDMSAWEELNSQLNATNASLKAMEQIAATLGPSLGKFAASLESGLLGQNFNAEMAVMVEAFHSATSATDRLQDGIAVAATGLQGLDNLAQSITGVINQYESGRKQGGVIGGIGSVLSSGPVSDALSMIPVVGSIVKPLGEAFSFIGNMFTARARRIAEAIDKNIDAINKAYQYGQTTLGDTISALQKQRQDAISQLSGVKGGKQQLDKILPNLDDEIAQLQKQASDIKKNFEDQLTVLMAGGTVLQNWTKSWMDINAQVKEYLDAGGDLATANQFLNQSLANQAKTLSDNLAEGQQQALQDALNLNELIKQRIALVKQEQQAEFGITTANAIERRTSTGVQVASELAQQRAQFKEQMDQLNQQITLAQQKVAIESQLFTIASDTATLQAQSNALTLASLQDQVNQYKEMASIVQSLSGLKFGGAFDPSTIPGFANGAPVVSPVTVHVNIDSGGQDVNSTKFARYLADAIQSQVSANRTKI